MKKIGVILSGCGVYDGSEIHEAVLTLLAISRSGAQAVCFAPDKQQVDVINHLTGEAMTETRNVLIEAARITRGEIRPLAQAGTDGQTQREIENFRQHRWGNTHKTKRFSGLMHRLCQRL